MTMSATEILVDEHRLIMRMVNVLTTLHKRLQNGDDVDANILTDVVDFFRMFADKGHHAKEEDILFPTLERHGVSPQGCPIGGLKSEHKQARILMTTLSDAIGKYKAGDPTAKRTISTTTKAAIDLYKDHIWREDYLLFPMSEKVLQKPDLEEVAKSYGEVEKKFGADFRAKYELLVSGLEKATNANQRGV